MSFWIVSPMGSYSGQYSLITKYKRKHLQCVIRHAFTQCSSKTPQIKNKCIIGIFKCCRCVNGHMKSHQKGIWVLHKIPQDLFYKNRACSDMSSRHLVCCLYIFQHMCLWLFVCSHWHWLDNVIQSLECVDIFHRLSRKTETVPPFRWLCI